MTRPALELLFARAAQGRIFLLLTAGGVLLGAMLSLAGWVQGRSRLLGAAADVLCVLVGAGMALGAAFLAGEGLRLYALLGLMLGAALYCAGLQPLWNGLMHALQKLFRPGRNARPG